VYIMQLNGPELDEQLIADLGFAPPNQFAACTIAGTNVGYRCPTSIVPQNAQENHNVRISWAKPNVGPLSQYELRRITGTAQGPTTLAENTSIPVIKTTSDTVYIDEELPDGIWFTYVVNALFNNTTTPKSGPTNLISLPAENRAPTPGVAEAYSTPTNTPLQITLTSQQKPLLFNDTDVDSPTSRIRAVLVQGPANGTITNFDQTTGTFTYTPNSGFNDTDAFVYTLNNGTWTDPDPNAASTAPVAMSPDSANITVTITIVSKGGGPKK
jgi:hypothetical protein